MSADPSIRGYAAPRGGREGTVCFPDPFQHLLLVHSVRPSHMWRSVWTGSKAYPVFEELLSRQQNEVKAILQKITCVFKQIPNTTSKFFSL